MSVQQHLMKSIRDAENILRINKLNGSTPDGKAHPETLQQVEKFKQNLRKSLERRS